MEWLLYSIEVQEPPAASSGRKYETVAARCRACTMNGGREEPCVSEGYQAQRIKAQGRPCAFVPLEPGNQLAAALMPFVTSERFVGLSSPMWELYTSDLTPDSKARLARRIISAAGNRRVIDAQMGRKD